MVMKPKEDLGMWLELRHDIDIELRRGKLVEKVHLKEGL
jgi:hypothetical protein